MKSNKQNKNDNDFSVSHGENNSININIFNNKTLMNVVGSLDGNLKKIEKISKSEIYFRGNTITIKGNKNKSNNQKLLLHKAVAGS